MELIVQVEVQESVSHVKPKFRIVSNAQKMQKFVQNVLMDMDLTQPISKTIVPFVAIVIVNYVTGDFIPARNAKWDMEQMEQVALRVLPQNVLIAVSTRVFVQHVPLVLKLMGQLVQFVHINNANYALITKTFVQNVISALVSMETYVQPVQTQTVKNAPLIETFVPNVKMVSEWMDQRVRSVQIQSAHIVLSIGMSALPVRKDLESVETDVPLAQTQSVSDVH